MKLDKTLQGYVIKNMKPLDFIAMLTDVRRAEIFVNAVKG